MNLNVNDYESDNYKEKNFAENFVDRKFLP